MRLFILLVAIVGFHFQCKSPHPQQTQPYIDSLPADDVTEAEAPVRHPDPFITIQDITTIEFINLKLTGVQEQLDDNAAIYKDCKDWEMDYERAEKLIRGFEPISAEDVDRTFITTKCAYTGEVKIGGITYQLAINGGGYLSLSTPDTTYLMSKQGEEGVQYDHYFPVRSTAGDPGIDPEQEEREEAQ